MNDFLFYSSDGRIGNGGLDIFMVNTLNTSLIEIDNIGKPLILQKMIFLFLFLKILSLDFYLPIDQVAKEMMIYIALNLNWNISEGTDDYYTMIKGETSEVISNSVLSNDLK